MAIALELSIYSKFKPFFEYSYLLIKDKLLI